jgi:hypothetical protein
MRVYLVRAAEAGSEIENGASADHTANGLTPILQRIFWRTANSNEGAAISALCAAI